ncbi:MAG: flavin reductase family protein, partial [bacterium]|nr:flavin reductase family protein [bacterium]
MNPNRAITFDPAENSPMDCQFLLSQLVVPRPIAMVSTRSPEGIANIAPMSYYLPITGDPMLIGVTMGLREDGGLKHTYQNAMASGDFVVNVTTEVFGDQIEVVAIEGPADSDEFELTGWTPVPATKVSSPAIGEALARLECEVRQVVDLGTPDLPFGEVHLVVAEVVWAVYDEAICNEVGRIDPLRLGAIGRLGLRSFLRTVDEGAY